MMLCSHYCTIYTLQVALDRDMEKRFVQLDFSSACDRLSHRVLLYKLRSIGIV